MGRQNGSRMGGMPCIVLVTVFTTRLSNTCACALLPNEYNITNQNCSIIRTYIVCTCIDLRESEVLIPTSGGLQNRADSFNPFTGMAGVSCKVTKITGLFPHHVPTNE